MATLTRQQITEDGIDATFAAAGGSGDVVTNSDGKTFLCVKNGGGSSITVTVAEQIAGATVDDPTYGIVTKGNAQVTIAAGGTGFMGPFKKVAFNNASSQIEISYSATTSVTVAALYI
jgi:hypothetical protein